MHIQQKVTGHGVECKKDYGGSGVVNICLSIHVVYCYEITEKELVYKSIYISQNKYMYAHVHVSVLLYLCDFMKFTAS